MKQNLCTLFFVFLGLNIHAYDFTVDGNYYDIVSIKDFTCRLAKANIGIANFVIPSNVFYNGKNVSVVGIGGYAFSYNKDVVNVEIPSSIISIGNYAFKDCTSLKSVTIPISVTSISEGAFYGCSSLDYINVPKSCKDLPVFLISGCRSLKKFVINNTIDKLPSYRQYGSNDIYDVLYGTLSYNTEKIGGVSIDSLIIEDSSNPLYAPSFTLTTSLNYKSCGYFRYLQTKYVYIGRDMTFKNTNDRYSDIDPFRGNPYIEEIEFGDMCTYTTNIRTESLTRVTFGKRMSIVNGNHFHDNVKELYLTGVVPPAVTNNFSNFLYVNAIIFVPKGTLEVYNSSDGWKNFWNIQEWDGTTDIEAIDTKSLSYEVSRYNGFGVKLSKEEKGLNIIRYNDGTVKKVIVK